MEIKKLKLNKKRLFSAWTTVGEFKIHAKVTNHKQNVPSIVLVPGLGMSGKYLQPAGEQLAENYNVYIPDLPGFGRSCKPKQILNIEQLADVLFTYIETIGLDKPILLGNSFGCQIITEYLTQHPLAASSVILIGPTIEASRRKPAQQIWGWLKNGIREPVPQLAIIMRDYAMCGLKRLIHTFRFALLDKIEDKLSQIRLPVLVVRGGEDKIISQAWADEVTRLLPMGKLVIIPDKAHTVNYNSPKELMRIMNSFFADIRNNEKQAESFASV